MTNGATEDDVTGGSQPGSQLPTAGLAEALGITRSAAGDYTVPANVLAEGFGLTPDALWREMKRGIVYGVVERGEGEDAGRTRLTFRYRARAWSMTLEETA